MAESKLDLRDLQAQFGGFGGHWPCGRFFYCRYESAAAGQRLLQRLLPLASCADLAGTNAVAINAAFSYAGLCALELDVDGLESFPADFKQGMRNRAALIGDVGTNAPEHWDGVWQGSQIHLWIGVYARSAALRESWTESFHDWVKQDGGVHVLDTQDVARFFADPARPMYLDDPQAEPKRPMVLEHFGFRDGVSNPAIAGLPGTPAAGSGRLSEDGKWSPLPAGEFLLGHIDADGEMPLAPQPPALARNGSYMVLRKLEQDVDTFRDYISAQAQNGGIGADDLASRILGRQRDGTPLSDPSTLNAFGFGNDPKGRRCPLGAHIRRANPRDSMGFGSVLVDRHRILRHGITYGQAVARGRKQREVNGESGQGLMFLAFNASFTRQFEFVSKQWINFGNDRDPFTGVQLEDSRMVVPGDGARPTVICPKLRQFVRTRGGDYFFLPGIAAVEALAKD